MNTSSLSRQVAGKSLRLAWNEGPTKGTAQDHDFHSDGTVEWRPAPSASTGPRVTASTATTPAANAERPAYSAVDVGDSVCLVSYLAPSGYTLTVALNLVDQSVAGIASNEKTWTPVRGRFEFIA